MHYRYVPITYYIFIYLKIDFKNIGIYLGTDAFWEAPEESVGAGASGAVEAGGTWDLEGKDACPRPPVSEPLLSEDSSLKSSRNCLHLSIGNAFVSLSKSPKDTARLAVSESAESLAD